MEHSNYICLFSVNNSRR